MLPTSEEKVHTSLKNGTASFDTISMCRYLSWQRTKVRTYSATHVVNGSVLPSGNPTISRLKVVQ